MPDFDVRVEEVTEAHIEPYAALSHAEYGDAAIANPAHLRWKFLSNPQGASVGIHLYDAGKLVGRLVAQPRRFALSNGTGRTAAYMVDLLIHPQARSVAALIRLASGVQSLREGFDFVFVTPNAVGMGVWRDLLQMKEQFSLAVYGALIRPASLLPVPAFVRPIVSGINGLYLGSLRLAANLAGAAVTLEEKWPHKDELQALDQAPRESMRGVRDEAFLRWRFASSPVFDYRIYFMRKKERLIGYVVTRKTRYAGYYCSFIVDAFATRDCSAQNWRSVRWKLVSIESQKGGANIMLMLGDDRVGGVHQLAGFPFFRVPVRFLPQPTPVFGEDWSSSDPAIEWQKMELSLQIAT